MENQFGPNQIELGSSENMRAETSFENSDNLLLINKSNIYKSSVSNPLTDPKIQYGNQNQTRFTLAMLHGNQCSQSNHPHYIFKIRIIGHYPTFRVPQHREKSKF